MNHLLLRTRNFSSQGLKEIPIDRKDVAVIYRMGSTTPTDKITKKHNVIEINSIEGNRYSANKLLMKKRFARGKIRTPRYFISKANEDDFPNQIKHYLKEWPTGIICKRYNSSKGNGIFLIKEPADAIKFIEYAKSCTPTKIFDSCNWVFERFSTYGKEYRIHCSLDGCFYSCRKEIKKDAKVKWHRHGDNSVWIYEDNPEFDKPDNWDDIVKGCVDALKSIHLDLGAFDVKVQKGKTPKYLILEVNSAPGLRDDGLDAYKKELTKIINNKIKLIK